MRDQGLGFRGSELPCGTRGHQGSWHATRAPRTPAGPFPAQSFARPFNRPIRLTQSIARSICCTPKHCARRRLHALDAGPSQPHDRLHAELPGCVQATLATNTSLCMCVCVCVRACVRGTRPADGADKGGGITAFMPHYPPIRGDLDQREIDSAPAPMTFGSG